MKVGHSGSIRALSGVALGFSVLFLVLAALGYFVVVGLINLSVDFVTDALVDMADEVDELRDYTGPGSFALSWVLGRFLMEGVRPGLYFFMYFIILSIIAGVMSVLVLSCTGSTDRYSNMTVWALVGAVCCLASLRVVSLVLFIIVIVFARKDRRKFAQYPAPGSSLPS